MSALRKVVTSALVISGATAISTMNEAKAIEATEGDTHTAEEEAQHSSADSSKSLTIEEELIEKALRNFANPLRRIQTEIKEVDREEEFKYEVKSGDTLSEIAKQFNIPMREIVEQNQIANPHRLSIGQKLTIRKATQQYVVHYGDSLEEIASSKGIDIDKIIAHNSFLQDNDDILFPGQKIEIPTIAPEPIHQPIATPKQQQKSSNVMIASTDNAEVSQTNLGSFAWPVKGRLTSSFGMRWGRMHNGMDIANSVNTPIGAARAGTVIAAYYNRGGYGNLIILDHGNGVETYYAHLNKINVKVGQKVGQGEVIGLLGSTGNTTGPHLHFEIRLNHKPLNPIKYLP